MEAIILVGTAIVCLLAVQNMLLGSKLARTVDVILALRLRVCRLEQVERGCDRGWAECEVMTNAIMQDHDLQLTTDCLDELTEHLERLEADRLCGGTSARSKRGGAGNGIKAAE